MSARSATPSGVTIEIAAPLLNSQKRETWMSHSRKLHNLWQRRILLLILSMFNPGDKTTSSEIARRIDSHLEAGGSPIVCTCGDCDGKKYSIHIRTAPTHKTRKTVEHFLTKSPPGHNGAANSLESHGMVKVIRN